MSYQPSPDRQTKFDIDDVLKATGGKLLSGAEGDAHAGFSAVTTDSRACGPGALFFALKGERHDGHEFVPEALAMGAAGIVAERPVQFKSPDSALFFVPSTLGALGALASAWRKGIEGLMVAAITGSNGKTTTKEMAASIIATRYQVLKNEGNLNNEIGLPLTLFKLTAEHERAVLEMGMNDFGEVARLTAIALPDTGAITNIGLAHLEKLGSVEGVARAKAELVEGFTDKNTLVVNTDDPLVVQIAAATRCTKITAAIESDTTDITARDIETSGLTSLGFTMRVEGRELPVRIQGIGLHNVSNALVAAGIGLSLGCGADEIQSGLERYTPQQMRLEVMTAPAGFKVINDAYNANPDSMRRGIEELLRLGGGGRTLAVLGDMLELGEYAQEEHRKLGEFASGQGVDTIIACGDFSGSVLQGAERCPSGATLLRAGDHEEAASMVSTHAGPGDTVLIKGSRGARMENVVKGLFAGSDTEPGES